MDNEEKKSLGVKFGDLVLSCSEVYFSEQPPASEARGIVIPGWTADSHGIEFDRSFNYPDTQGVDIFITPFIPKSPAKNIRFNVEKIKSLFDVFLTCHINCCDGLVVITGIYENKMIRLYLRNAKDDN